MFGLLVSAILSCSFALSPISANALIVTPEEQNAIFQRYEEVSCEELVTKENGNCNPCYRELQSKTSGTKLLMLKDYRWNYTVIQLNAGFQAFCTAYDTYKEQLDFDVFDYVWNEEGCYYIEFYDIKNADGVYSIREADFSDKKALVSKLVQKAQATGAKLESASYCKYQAYGQSGAYIGWQSSVNGKSTTYPNSVYISTVTEDQLDTISKFAASFTTDLQIIPIDSGYCVTSMNSYRDACAFSDAVKSEIPSASVKIYTEWDESSSPVSTASVDLLRLADFTPGDVNLDGEISLTDAILIEKTAAEAVVLTEEQKSNADLDSNGQIDSNDALQLLQFLLRLTNAIC